MTCWLKANVVVYLGGDPLLSRIAVGKTGEAAGV